MGYHTTASGNRSTAMGSSTIASDASSTAMGCFTTASGYISTAMGFTTTASGKESTAMGRYTTASNYYSTAMGDSTTAGGYVSTAMGFRTMAPGSFSTAMGSNTSASGDYSMAMGNNVSTDSKEGAFIVGDNSLAPSTNSSADNEMTMRFNGGYRIFSNSALTTGVYMEGGVSGWTDYCDRNKKENFRPIDGEQLLLKIRTLPITEWNYKGTDKSIRYIGPVAQDFHSAFHLGGNDSLGINSICINGVNIAAIQALEKRTSELQAILIEVKAEKEKVAELEKQNIERDKTISTLTQKIEKLTQLLSSSTTINRSQFTTHLTKETQK
jgi:hypothetical protein